MCWLRWNFTLPMGAEGGTSCLTLPKEPWNCSLVGISVPLPFPRLILGGNVPFACLDKKTFPLTGREYLKTGLSLLSQDNWTGLSRWMQMYKLLCPILRAGRSVRYGASRSELLEVQPAWTTTRGTVRFVPGIWACLWNFRHALCLSRSEPCCFPSHLLCFSWCIYTCLSMQKLNLC